MILPLLTRFDGSLLKVECLLRCCMRATIVFSLPNIQSDLLFELSCSVFRPIGQHPVLAFIDCRNWFLLTHKVFGLRSAAYLSVVKLGGIHTACGNAQPASIGRRKSMCCIAAKTEKPNATKS